jgi:hypothetical protein
MRHAAARRPAVGLCAADAVGTGAPPRAATAGSSARGDSASPRNAAATTGSASMKREFISSNGTPAISKSRGSAPAAKPAPTRPGKRAAVHAMSSTTWVSGRRASSCGHAAAQIVDVASNAHVDASSGFGR